MRTCVLALLVACSGSPRPAPHAAAPPVVVEPVAAGETLAADTPRTTVAGNAFIAPAGWKLVVRGAATLLTAPEGGSTLVLADVRARDAAEAVTLAWAAYGKQPPSAVDATLDLPDRDGWSKIQIAGYRTSPSEQRTVSAQARFANGMWTVILHDVADAVAQKRSGQISLALGQLLPKGFARESFAGKRANVLDAARVAELTRFIEVGMAALEVPGVALGLVQDGKVVFVGGFGVRELGKPAKVDGDTRFIIASNTKALTTLMLAKLVDENQLAWDQPVTQLLPQFALGDADTTRQVLVKHLVCACTGLPRQDLEMIFEAHRNDTADKVLAELAKMRPTSKFGELFQYSNPMAAAAGFVGGHVAFPKLALGKAYDEAMRTRVFAPLGMTSATLDFQKAQTGNFAAAHADDIDGKVRVAPRTLNELIVPLRPAGGAWVSTRDMLRYIQMELAEGTLPDGKPYIGKAALAARRAPQVTVGADTTYGMGLMVTKRSGITLVDHGGDVIGFHSNMMWLPEHGVGAFIVVNSDSGAALRSGFRRKLVEVLFDGVKEADAALGASMTIRAKSIATTRSQLAIPADDAHAQKLAARYANDALGSLVVTRTNTATTFDFGEWKSQVATKQNPDGTVSFVTIDPGLSGIELVPGTAAGKRTLVLRDAQHEYVFTAQ